MSVSRWNAPRGYVIARRYLHSTHVRHLNVVHAIRCTMLARVPLAAVRAVNLAALPPKARLCPVCIAPARRDPARVEAPRPEAQRADDDHSRRTP